MTNDHLLDKLAEALALLRQANVYLETWYQQSHSGTGMGAKHLKMRIDLFVSDFESEVND